MRMLADAVRRPARVFLSFAGDDRPTALRLRHDLERAGIEALVDTESFPPGGSVPLDICQALSWSDYYLLFWSRHAVDRPWVSAEWSAAFTMDMRRRGGFLFVARLDATELPPLLAPRRYLDATGDWDAFVDELIGIWKRGRFLPEPVLPAPAVPSDTGTRAVEVYVRNRALAVSHLIVVPDVVTGAALWALVRESLQLKESVSRFMGEASLSFRYELSTRGQQIPDDEGVRMHIPEGAHVDLAVQVEVHAHHETVTTMQWRGPTSTRAAAPDMDPRLIQALLDDAFGHLRPGAAPD